MLLYGIVYKLMMTQGKIMAGLAFLGLLVMTGCGLLSVILFAKAKEVEQARSKRPVIQAEELTPGETTKRLLSEGQLEQRPSVTERTTELLFAQEKSAAKEL